VLPNSILNAAAAGETTVGVFIEEGILAVGRAYRHIFGPKT
jgi:hypothetical protein